MGVQWINYVRRNGELKVFNKATAWASGVTKAIQSFNDLKLGVKLTTAESEASANIVVILAAGPMKYDYSDPYYTGVLSTKPDFKADELHGSCMTAMDPKKNYAITFAAVFLPGKVKATTGQKQVIVLHEFIHACGLNGTYPDGTKLPQQDHDIEGIMVGQVQKSGKGLIEMMPAKGVKAMPPIRIGGKALCMARGLWSHPDQCEEE